MNGRELISENNVVKDELYEAFKDSIICPICSQIIIDPVMCMACQKVFCRGCVQKWGKRDNRCPFRCENPKYKESLEIKNILSNLTFECEKCGEIFNYKDISNHGNCTQKINIKKLKKTYKNVEFEQLKEKGRPIQSIKIITLGGSMVGKTSLISTFIEGKSSMDYLSTTGLNDQIISLQLSDGSLVNCRIFDTAGQERFRSLSINYYRDADCCLLVYDITSKKSFEEIKKFYIKEINDNCKKDIKVILLGNKTDLEGEGKREVSPEEGANLALKNEYIFMESSCAHNKNVADAFVALVEKTNIEMRKNENINENKTLKTKKSKDKKHSKKIC